MKKWTTNLALYFKKEKEDFSVVSYLRENEDAFEMS